MTEHKRGFFIVLDGNDGSGKATQTKLLEERMKAEGRPVRLIDFPRYTDNVFGELVGECLAGQRGDFASLDPRIASCLYALDRFESSATIRDALDSGCTVIADRFTSSNQIHQGGKIRDPNEREAFLLWLDNIEHHILSIPRPDFVIYLQVPTETSLALLSEKRAKKNVLLEEGARDVVEEDRQYLIQSHETALWLSGHFPAWNTIDCMRGNNIRSREDIHEDIWKVVREAVS